MVTEIFPSEPPPPKRRVVLDALKATFGWLKNRRSARAVARAIATNQVATAALAASVAAAGIGSYGAVQAHEAQNATARTEHDAAARFATLAAEVRNTRANVAGLLARTAELETKSPIQLRALGFRTASIARELSQLADRVAAMPSSDPQTAVLAAQVAEAASQAHRAMRKAETAATAAAEADHDEFARAAASQAAVDAALAADQAHEAQRVAENAQHDAEYAPVVFAFADGGPYERSFSLPRAGVYTVTLTYGGDGLLLASMQAGDGTVARGTHNVTIDYVDQHFNAYTEGTVTDASVTFTLARDSS